MVESQPAGIIGIGLIILALIIVPWLFRKLFL